MCPADGHIMCNVQCAAQWFWIWTALTWNMTKGKLCPMVNVTARASFTHIVILQEFVPNDVEPQLNQWWSVRWSITLRLSWVPMILCHAYGSPPVHLILKWLRSVHAHRPRFFKIHFITILPLKHASTKYTSVFQTRRFCAFLVCSIQATYPILPDVITLIVCSEESDLWTSWLHHYRRPPLNPPS
jgi:hypothetical protein